MASSRPGTAPTMTMRPRPPSSKSRRHRGGKRASTLLSLESDAPALISALKLGGDLAEVFRVARPELAAADAAPGGSRAVLDVGFPRSVEAACKKSAAEWTSLLVRSSRGTAPKRSSGRRSWKTVIASAVEKKRDLEAPTHFAPSLLRPATAPLERPTPGVATVKTPAAKPHVFPAAPALTLAPLDSSSDDDAARAPAPAADELVAPRPRDVDVAAPRRPTLERQASMVEYARGSARRSSAAAAAANAAAKALPKPKPTGRFKRDVEDAMSHRSLSPRPAVLASCAGDDAVLDLSHQGLGDDYAPLLAAVWKPTTGLGGPDQT